MSFLFSLAHNASTEYDLNGVNLKIANAENDLGVWTDNKLVFDKHIIAKIKTANGIIVLTKKMPT